MTTPPALYPYHVVCGVNHELGFCSRCARARGPEVSRVNAHRADLYNGDRTFQRALIGAGPPRRYDPGDEPEARILELCASELREAFYAASSIAKLDEIRASLLEIDAALSERALVSWRGIEPERASSPAPRTLTWEEFDELDG